MTRPSLYGYWCKVFIYNTVSIFDIKEWLLQPTLPYFCTHPMLDYIPALACDYGWAKRLWNSLSNSLSPCQPPTQALHSLMCLLHCYSRTLLIITPIKTFYIKNAISFHILTHWGLVMSYGGRDLEAPSHYMMWSSDIHLRAISQPSIAKISVKMTNFKFHSNLPGVSELKLLSWTHCGLITPNGNKRKRSESTLAQVMACCLTAPSHYLNQCWLIISEVQWHPY